MVSFIFHQIIKPVSITNPVDFYIFWLLILFLSKDKLVPSILDLYKGTEQPHSRQQASHSGHHLHYPSRFWSGRRFRCFWTVSPETRQTSERRGSAVDRGTDERVRLNHRTWIFKSGWFLAKHQPLTHLDIRQNPTYLLSTFTALIHY